MKRSKKYKEVAKKIEKSKQYTIDEVVALLKETSTTKFDASIDIMVSLKLKDKQKKESVKGTVTFPHPIGTAVKVVVIAEAPDQEIAKKAGADFVGLDDIVKKIEGGWLDFGVLIATPETMIKVSRLGKYIGKQGLMPNPKNGTVTKDIEKAVKSFKAGKTSFKMNEGGTFQFRIAKVNMSTDEIKDNLIAFLKAIFNEVKKYGDNTFQKILLSSTMGPAIKIDVNNVLNQLK